MKNNLNKVNFITKSLGVLGVFAGVGLASGALAYHHLNQEIKVGDSDSVLTAKLVEVAQVNSLLLAINRGQLDVARNYLSSKLNNDLAEVKSIGPSADAPRQQFALAVVENIQHQEKKHPEFYGTASRGAAPVSATVTQDIRH